MSQPPPLSHAEVLTGGWSEKYARVLKIEQIGCLAVAVVDGNGDGAELELEHWEFVDGEWRCLSSMGFGPLDQTPGDSGSFGLDGAYFVGKADPGTRVSVSWLDDRREVVADANGIWAYASDRGTDDPNAVPRIEGTPSRWNPGGLRTLRSLPDAPSYQVGDRVDDDE